MKAPVKIILAAALLFPIAAGSDLLAYKFEFVTVSDVVKKVKKKFGETGTYQASFSILTEKMGKKKRQSGIVKYKSSNRLLILFTSPQGQKIISNGKMMWLYIPSMNIVAEQDLRYDSGIFSSGTKDGLNRLFSKYHYRFASSDQPEKMKDGTKLYTMLLSQKESRSGYRKMKLWISEDYFIVRAVGETSTGKKVDIKFSNIKTGISLPNGIFKMDIPARARVIKNPMISEE